MVCHMLCAIFVYTSDQIYPLSVQVNNTGHGITFEGGQMTIYSRIISRFGIPFLTGAILILAYVVFKPLIKKLMNLHYETGRNYKARGENGKDLIKFSDIKERMQRNCLVSYNIRENPEYADIIDIVQQKVKL